MSDDPLDRPIEIPGFEAEPTPVPVLSVRQARRMLFLSGGIVGTVLAALIVVAGYLFVQAQDATDALCTFRGDLQQRVTDGRKFLHEHPEGFAGITAVEIQQGIDNQQRTIDSLDTLDCPPAGLTPSSSPSPPPSPSASPSP